MGDSSYWAGDWGWQDRVDRSRPAEEREKVWEEWGQWANWWGPKSEAWSAEGGRAAKVCTHTHMHVCVCVCVLSAYKPIALTYLSCLPTYLLTSLYVDHTHAHTHTHYDNRRSAPCTPTLCVCLCIRIPIYIYVHMHGSFVSLCCRQHGKEASHPKC